MNDQKAFRLSILLVALFLCTFLLICFVAAPDTTVLAPADAGAEATLSAREDGDRCTPDAGGLIDVNDSMFPDVYDAATPDRNDAVADVWPDLGL